MAPATPHAEGPAEPAAAQAGVSRLCGEIDDKVAAFLNRPLEGEWPYLWLDATPAFARAGST